MAPSDVVQWSLDGMTRPFKGYCLCLIAIPRVVIGLLLALIGGLYIKLTDAQEDLVLNTLAVNFVVDIDEILYQAFTSEATKGNLDNMKTVSVDVDNRIRLWLWFSSTVLHPMVVLGVTAVVMHIDKEMVDNFFGVE